MHGGRALNYWMIAAIALAVGCAALLAALIRANARVSLQEAQRNDNDALRQELNNLRGEVARRRREAAGLHHALEEERKYSDALDRDIDELEMLLSQSKSRIDAADAQRIETEKQVHAGRMRIGLLERQVSELQNGQLAQEQMYRDILREKEEIIAKLQKTQSKQRPKRKNDVLDQQITLSDILGGN